MPTEEEANAAISALNGTMLHGYKMNVEVSSNQCANYRVAMPRKFLFTLPETVNFYWKPLVHCF